MVEGKVVWMVVEMERVVEMKTWRQGRERERERERRMER